MGAKTGYLEKSLVLPLSRRRNNAIYMSGIKNGKRKLNNE